MRYCSLCVYSDAITFHPLIPLPSHTNNPNCCLCPLLIPDPVRIPYTTIPPYMALTISPPQQLPPPPLLHPTSRSSSTQWISSCITGLLNPSVSNYPMMVDMVHFARQKRRQVLMKFKEDMLRLDYSTLFRNTIIAF